MSKLTGVTNNPFKVGDRVVRITGYFNGMRKYDVDTIENIREDWHHTGDQIDLEVFGKGHASTSLQQVALVEKSSSSSCSNYPNKPHQHAEVIKAWADGAAIEALFRISGKWVTVTDEYPNFFTNIEYRIKPVIDNQAEIAKLMKELEEVSVRLRKEVQVINSKLNELIIS